VKVGRLVSQGIDHIKANIYTDAGDGTSKCANQDGTHATTMHGSQPEQTRHLLTSEFLDVGRDASRRVSIKVLNQNGGKDSTLEAGRKKGEVCSHLGVLKVEMPQGASSERGGIDRQYLLVCQLIIHKVQP